MNVLERRRKYPALENLGYGEVIFNQKKRPAPDVDWIPARVMEDYIAKSRTIFSQKDPVSGLYIEWSMIQTAKSEVLGFCLGPYDIPDSAKMLEAEKGAIIENANPDAGKIIGIDGKPLGVKNENV